MDSSQNEKLVEMENRLSMLQSQKDRLIRELDDIEERYEKTDRLYKKFFPLIIDALVTRDTEFGKACKNLSKAMKKGDSEGKIEYICDQVKTAMLKEDPGAGGLKKKSLFSAFKKDDSSSLLDEIKKGYHESVHILKASLGDAYLKKLDRITSQIYSISDIRDINQVREAVFDLIRDYIETTSVDREKVASFVQEIVVRIFEIESILMQSYEHSDRINTANQGFEAVLSSEMQVLKDRTAVSTSLEQLKEQISQRLASIEKALQEKQSFEKALREQEARKRNDFTAGLDQLKQELNKATRHSEALEKKLNQDPLTGAYNRRAYDKKIVDEMERFLRYDTTFSLLMIDADRFKNLNDRYGHAIGDKCLKEIIKRTLPLLRKNDMLARYGGEEFVVIMPQTDLDGAREAAEKIRKTIEKIGFIYKEEKVKVTVSIGVSQARKGDQTHDAVFERADIALYQAKEKGRNQVVVHDTTE